MTEITPVLEFIKAANSESTVINAPGQEALSYGDLLNLVENTVSTLNRNGVRRNDRVAIVLPTGAEMAACFIATSCAATAAPLNPAYQKAEFDFYLSDLKAGVLIVEENSQSPSIEAARELHIPILTLKKGGSLTAGEFELEPVDKLQQEQAVITPELPVETILPWFYTHPAPHPGPRLFR